MAIKINIPGVGEVEIEGAAQESTMQQILAAVSKSDKSKQSDEKARHAEDKKNQDARKKETQGLKDQGNQLDKTIDAEKKRKKSTDDAIKSTESYGEMMDQTTAELKASVGASIKEMAGAAVQMASGILTTYDQMAEKPIEAAANIAKTWLDLGTEIAHIGVDITTAIGKGITGIIPMIGSGLAMFVGALGDAANAVIDAVNSILTTINSVLEKEFQKRADQLFSFAGIGGSFAGGMTEMAALATASGVGINTFTKAVVDARGEMTGMGVSVGEATTLLSNGFAGLASTTTKSGVSVRDSLLGLGYTFQQQGKLMAGAMAQMKSIGIDLKFLSSSDIANYTEQYAKNLKVITDITGQDAQKLLDQARAESQRGALMEKLTASQAVAFQDAYAMMAALPASQGPKLQAALAQMLAGGTVTDPVIAGNEQIMAMLQKTAQQVSAGNVNMITATQKNLGDAANAYRAAGDSATDFATLMNPSGASAVAQGMSQFGNALREYRYDPTAAEASMQASTDQAKVADGLTGAYVGLQDTMTGFQVAMEGVSGQALPAYTQVLAYTSQKTLDFMTSQISAFTEFMTGPMGFQETMTYLGKLVGAVPGGQAVTGAAKDIVDAADTIGFGAPGLIKAAGIDKLANGGSAESIPQLAAGGVVDGPTTGYPATLHGAEAVVPLPDGKNIPIDIKQLQQTLIPPEPTTQDVKSSTPLTTDNTAINSLNASMTKQSSILNQILDAMNKNNKYTSGILQASM